MNKSHRGKGYCEIEVEIIKQDLNKGKSYKDICEHLKRLGYNRSAQSVSCFVKENRKKYGFPNFVTKIFSKQTDDKIIALLKKGYNSPRIAEELNRVGVKCTALQVSDHFAIMRKKGYDLPKFKVTNPFQRGYDVAINIACKWLRKHRTDWDETKDGCEQFEIAFRNAMEEIKK